MDIKKMQLQMKRNAMPMQQHWHIKRNFKDIFDAMFKPFVDTTALIAATTKIIADAKQKRVFNT